MSKLIPITTPLREFKGHEECVDAVAVFSDKRRMVTGSQDSTLRLWDLKTGVVLKEMEGHCTGVLEVVVSRGGQLIASCGSNEDELGVLVVWHGETGKPLTQYTESISMDFSPDGTVLAIGSWDGMMKLWNTQTWEQQGDPWPIEVICVRYSPSGEHLPIATKDNIQIYNSGTRERVASFKAHTRLNLSLVWTPNGTRLLTSGDQCDPTIREWDTTTWQQVGVPWTDHSDYIHAIAVNPAGTLIASVSRSNQHVHLRRLSDRQTIAIFKHSSFPTSVTFSVDGKHILSGGKDMMISEWAVPRGIHPKILTITTARIACINGDLFTTEELLTRDINTDPNNHISYAHRSFVMARKCDWDHALEDAIKSISIQPSLTGYISKGIALCGKGHVLEARAAFDVAFMYTDQDSETIHFLLLIKAITLFNADRHDEAILLLKELTTGCPNADTRACHIVEAYLRVQLGIKALDGARHAEAADHFTVAANSSAFSSKSDIHEIYKDFVVLFGWDLKILWLTAHQKRCDALLRAGRPEEALTMYLDLTGMSDSNTKASCLDWSNAFKKQCSLLYLADGDDAFSASDYDRAIDLFSVAIDLDPASDTIFAHRSKAKLEKMLWGGALFDALKVIELNPSSHIGYQVKHEALHGAQCYDEAVEAFQMMLSKLNDAPNMQIRKLREQYISPSESERIIQKVIDVEFDTAPLRLLDTATGILCHREAQISTFKTSAEYKELLSSTMNRSDPKMERIVDVVATYFRCVMLSHRWEGTEPLLHDIQDKVVYKLKAAGDLMKLQSFCKVVRDMGYHWAWVDTCCIDQNDNVEVQKSLNSMFAWYHRSAL